MEKLKNIGTIFTGNTPTTSDIDNYSSDDICFVKPSDISGNGLTRLSSSDFYISEYARKKARILPANSVLVTCIGIIGKVALNSVECAFNQQINAIVPDENKCIPEYLAYALIYRSPQLRVAANSAVVPILNKSQFAEIEIPVPTLDTQMRIVRILNKAEQLISFYEKQMLRLDDLIKARFVEMFGTFPANEKRWTTGTIRELVTDVRYGSSRKAADGDSGRYPYLRMNNITYGGELDLTDTKTIDVPDDELAKCTVRRGDLLFNRTNSKELVGKTCVYNRDEMMVLAGFVVRVRLNEKALPEFVSAFMNTDFSKRMLLSMCKTAIGQANINAQELQNIGIYIPPITIQKEFVHFKEQVDKSKFAVQKALDEAQMLFDRLMQQYFN